VLLAHGSNIHCTSALAESPLREAERECRKPAPIRVMDTSADPRAHSRATAPPGSSRFDHAAAATAAYSTTVPLLGRSTHCATAAACARKSQLARPIACRERLDGLLRSHRESAAKIGRSNFGTLRGDASAQGGAEQAGRLGGIASMQASASSRCVAARLATRARRTARTKTPGPSPRSRTPTAVAGRWSWRRYCPRWPGSD
jgi:hypothetical protein